MFVGSWMFVAVFLGGPMLFSLKNCTKKKPRLDYSTYMDATFRRDTDTSQGRQSDYKGGNLFDDIDLEPRDPRESI